MVIYRKMYRDHFLNILDHCALYVPLICLQRQGLLEIYDGLKWPLTPTL